LGEKQSLRPLKTDLFIFFTFSGSLSLNKHVAAVVSITDKQHTGISAYLALRANLIVERFRP